VNGCADRDASQQTKLRSCEAAKLRVSALRLTHASGAEPKRYSVELADVYTICGVGAVAAMQEACGRP
jgi:hypothetical protein